MRVLGESYVFLSNYDLYICVCRNMCYGVSASTSQPKSRAGPVEALNPKP